MKKILLTLGVLGILTVAQAQIWGGVADLRYGNGYGYGYNYDYLGYGYGGGLPVVSEIINGAVTLGVVGIQSSAMVEMSRNQNCNQYQNSCSNQCSGQCSNQCSNQTTTYTTSSSECTYVFRGQDGQLYLDYCP